MSLPINRQLLRLQWVYLETNAGFLQFAKCHDSSKQLPLAARMGVIRMAYQLSS